MPARFAISSVEAPWSPRSANSARAARRISSRRSSALFRSVVTMAAMLVINHKLVKSASDGLECTLPVPRDRPLQPFVQVDARPEAEQLARLLHVRDAQLDVGVVERLEDDLSGAAREPLHPLRQVVDRDRRAGIADVERLADRLRTLETEQRPLDHVVHVAPRADLRAVAVDRQLATRERGLDEGADRAAADLSRAVDVEGMDSDRRQPELVVVGVRHVLAGELRHGVRPAGLADGADRRDLALADVERVRAEHFARRKINDPLER